MIKIKRKKKINENLSKTSNELSGITLNTSSIKDINDMFNQVVNQKKVELRKIYIPALDRVKRIPLSQVNVPIKVNVTNIDTGNKEQIEFIPSEIAAQVDIAISSARKMQEDGLNIILSYLTKPIIWSFDLPTAASDGIRIGFNPAFAYQLIVKGMNKVKQLLTQRKMDNNERYLESTKSIIFIIVHEIYHQIYRHREAEARKPETQNGANHKLANIAMDVEINRDIERQLSKYFTGITNEIGGMFDIRFPTENWEEIFDAYYNGSVDCPVDPNTFAPYNGQLKPKKVELDDTPSPPGGSQQFPPDYVKGYDQAIRDVTDKKVDPITFKPKPPTSLYEQGYNAAIKDIKSGLENGIQMSDNYDSDNNNSASNLPQIPWDIPQDQKQKQSKSGQQGQQSQQGQNQENNDNSENSERSDDSGVSLKNQQNQNQQGQNQQGQNQQGQNQQGNDEYSDDQDGEEGYGSSQSSQNQQDNQNQQRQKSGQGFGDDDENGDVDNDQQEQPPMGEPMEQTGPNGESEEPFEDKLGLSDKSDDYRKAFEEELQKELDKAMGNDVEEIDTSNDTIEQTQAREDAKQMLKDALEEAERQISEEAKQPISDEEIAAEYEGKEFDTEIANKYDKADMLSQSDMAEMAERAGDPYTSEELTADPSEIAKQFNERNQAALQNANKMLSKKIQDLQSKLAAIKTLANWKEKLKKHFRDAMKGAEDDVRSRKVMAQKWRDDRYNPYKTIEETKTGAANIFYLIDDSGSMWGVGGEDIFLKIFKQVLVIEKTCHVALSARAFFASGAITPNMIEMWDDKTKPDKIIQKLGKQSSNGFGTEIAMNVLSVTKLKKPYYYQTPGKHTTIIVFTDGEECSGNNWAELLAIPSKIRKDIVFVIINTLSQIEHISAQIQARGIPLKNILGINTSDIK